MESAPQIILHEIMAYEKRYGKKPALLILNDEEFKESFFTNCLKVTMANDCLDFRRAGHFYGVPFYFKNIWSYGGACKWMLVGE